MRKLLLTAIAATAIATQADAVLKKGDVAPDFTLNDINGVSHHLYAYLDSGYTVIIDESAAWCSPCWAVHSSHVFNNLIDQYGPNGTVQAKKIRVIFIEGEKSNTTAQLHGPKTGGGLAVNTQGDWVTGTKYPIIDNPPAAIRDAYLDGGFPTFTVIGQDRIVYEQTAGYSNPMLQTTYWTNFLTNNVVPTYGPSATTDAKIIEQDLTDVYLCSATPKIRIQNYGAQAITAATINVYSGTNTTPIATQNWTGNLAKYATADVPITPGFTQAGPYKFEVVVANDAVATNNTTTITSLPVITAAQTTATPTSEDFQSVTEMAVKYILDANGEELFVLSSKLSDQGGNPITVVGANGQATNCIAVLYPNVAQSFKGELMLGNYNTSSAAAPAFKFDLAYQLSATGTNDKLEILVSTDCGASWKSVYDKSGSQLATKAGVSATPLLPAATADWRGETTDPLPKDNNLFVKIVATTTSRGTANFGWIDNFNFVTSTDVSDVIAANDLQLYPNPARDAATLTLNVVKASDITIQVIDMTGRIVANVANSNFAAGTHKVDISTGDLPSGIYNVKIQTEEGSRTERLSIVK